jgi:hypothetical protein
VDQPLLRIGKEHQRKIETDVQIQAPKELRLEGLDCKSCGAKKEGIIFCNSVFFGSLTKKPDLAANQGESGQNQSKMIRDHSRKFAAKNS